MGPIVLTQLGLSVLAGAALVKSVIDQKTMMGSGTGQFPRCPSCNGTGRVSCMCSRWPDGDVGCRTCAGSGRMACSSCGGTGTGRPIPVQISVRPPNRST
ncbi:hypothetical protein BC332_28224 [Capsicum chinense]|uniref:Protein SSUH2 homolog n=1 Tax=Capsicum annuum TaxID=4072 RepID=A0A1U8ER07_CAPAN|nr:hypothetical protein T459_27903 [Capsicum annuum]PHU02973.1 hypothetical protein BC332_28224 [Capsicum chinense]